MWARLAVGLAIVWVVLSAAGGDVLRLLAAPALHQGSRYIPWLAGGVFFYGLASLANTSLLLDGKMRYAAYWWVGGSVVCLCINVLLVPSTGALGAAIAQCMSYGVIALGIAGVSHRVLPLPIPWFRLSGALLLAFAAGTIMSHAWATQPLWSLVYKLPVGILIAAILLYSVARDWFLRMFAKIFQVRIAGKV